MMLNLLVEVDIKKGMQNKYTDKKSPLLLVSNTMALLWIQGQLG